MPRWRVIRTPEDILRRIKQGRGQGEGKDYDPWLKVHEVPSRGRSHKVPGLKTERTHHFLSDGEYSLFLLSEFRRRVVDLREQYPLFGPPRTSEIAEKLGIRHPRYPGTTLDIVMTTDLVLTVEDESGKKRYVARSVKRTSDLTPRSLEKLEIERRHWEEQGVPWALITENDIPKQEVQNIEWLRGGAFLEKRLKNLDLQAAFLDRLNRADRSLPLGILLNLVAKEIHVDRFDAISLFKCLAWRRWIEIDLKQPIKLTAPTNFKVLQTRRKK